MPIWTNYDSKNTADSDDTFLIADSTSKNKVIRQLKFSALWAAIKAKLPSASTTAAGIAKLSNATNSDSADTAATSRAVKSAYDKAGSRTVIAISQACDATADLQYTGVSVTIPAQSYYAFTATAVYEACKPMMVGLFKKPSANLVDANEIHSGTVGNYNAAIPLAGYTDTDQTFYVFAKYSDAPKTNCGSIRISGFYITDS